VGFNPRTKAEATNVSRRDTEFARGGALMRYAAIGFLCRDATPWRSRLDHGLKPVATVLDRDAVSRDGAQSLSMGIQD
jgi:hypothetical protein